MIIHHLDQQGGFTCGDTETMHTAYAYPSSIHATDAKRDPDKVAAEMLRQMNYLNSRLSRDTVVRANERNWRTLHNTITTATAKLVEHD